MIFSTAKGYGAGDALPGACERRARKKLGRRGAVYGLSSPRRSSSGSLAMLAAISETHTPRAAVPPSPDHPAPPQKLLLARCPAGVPPTLDSPSAASPSDPQPARRPDHRQEPTGRYKVPRGAAHFELGYDGLGWHHGPFLFSIIQSHAQK
jgi:hypothetical protein